MFNEVHPFYKALDKVYLGTWYGTRKGKPISDLLKEEKLYLEEARVDLLSNEATPESPAFFEVLFVLCHSRLLRRLYSKPRGEMSYTKVGAYSFYDKMYFPIELEFMLKHLYQHIVVEGSFPNLTISSLLIGEYDKIETEAIKARLEKELKVAQAKSKVQTYYRQYSKQYYEKNKEKITEKRRNRRN